MGQFASRIHSKEDGKVYNILPLGDMPTVVFGRVIKPNSVPGMQYYFPDGKVKWHEEDSPDNYNFVKPYGSDSDKPTAWGTPCIFTVPDNFDYSKLSDVEYVKQYCRTAKNLNAKTTSPNYIIIDGHIKCIKPLDKPGRYVVISTKKRKKEYDGYGLSEVRRRVTTMCGVVINTCKNFRVFLENTKDGGLLHAVHMLHNKFTLIPVGRVKYKIKYTNSGKTRKKYNITAERHHFERTVKYFDFSEEIAGEWKIREV